MNTSSPKNTIDTDRIKPQIYTTQLHRAPKSGSGRRSDKGAAPEYIKPGRLNKVNVRQGKGWVTAKTRRSVQLCERKRGETLLRVILIDQGWYLDVYLVPMDTTTASQYIARIIRLNRRLPVGHRVRGDVAA